MSLESLGPQNGSFMFLPVRHEVRAYLQGLRLWAPSLEQLLTLCFLQGTDLLESRGTLFLVFVSILVYRNTRAQACQGRLCMCVLVSGHDRTRVGLVVWGRDSQAILDDL